MKRFVVSVVLLGCLSGFGLSPQQAEARTPRWQLVCFERSSLVEALNKVVNAQQFLRNDRMLRSGSCDFAQIPSNSTARFAGFHQSPQGFIYPLFRVRYATTGQSMYATDGIFLGSAWRVSARLRDCRGIAFTDICLIPASCEVLDGFVSRGGPPGYVAIPPSCQVFRTQ